MSSVDAPAVAEKLYDDPVTGEKVSKSELKRRTKQREKDAEKQKKLAEKRAQELAEGVEKKVSLSSF